ncbi:MAG: 7-carboxy-7-deazaguanine synthase QueE [Candidatus Acidifodinimicrobium sp.]
MSETFYSIQGEGKRIGVPSYFVRLTGCNLHCGFDVKNLDKIDQSNLQEYKTGEWICDSVGVWKKGKKYSTNDIVSFLLEEKKKYNYNNLVITGGEPLLQINELWDMLYFIRYEGYHGTVEVETNGTIDPASILWLVDNFNVSPKLYLGRSNEWFGLDKRWYAVEKEKVIWKFVIAKEEDISLVKQWAEDKHIDPSTIYLMPASESREELISNSQFVVERAKELGFNFTTRLQIIIWDRLTGV